MEDVMSEKTVSLQPPVVIGERTTRMVCPLEMEVTQEEFYAELKNAIESHRLPVTCVDCTIESQETKSPDRGLLVDMTDAPIRSFRILVTFVKFGTLAYVDRKHILIRPQLPPRLSTHSPELPPRLDSASKELPPRILSRSAEYYASKPSAQASTIYWNQTHKTRVLQMEARRQQRRAMIEERRQEIRQALENWWRQSATSLAELERNPHLDRFRDSIDTMIEIVVQKLLEDRGAQVKELAERTHIEEEIRQRLDTIRQEF
jgi:hypothetical protein